MIPIRVKWPSFWPIGTASNASFRNLTVWNYFSELYLILKGIFFGFTHHKSSAHTVELLLSHWSWAINQQYQVHPDFCRVASTVQRRCILNFQFLNNFSIFFCWIFDYEFLKSDRLNRHSVMFSLNQSCNFQSQLLLHSREPYRTTDTYSGILARCEVAIQLLNNDWVMNFEVNEWFFLTVSFSGLSDCRTAGAAYTWTEKNKIRTAAKKYTDKK